ncbi:hypothetical protein [Prevotella sp. MGM2]|nr:hypothetical protein [Prevotella sp. MGM2]
MSRAGRQQTVPDGHEKCRPEPFASGGILVAPLTGSGRCKRRGG